MDFQSYFVQLQFQMQEQRISNLTISSQIISISPEDQQGQLTLTNTHKQNALLFKIKTKIQKIIDVKPSKGFLLPGEKSLITFKIVNKLSKEQCEKYQKNLQFLLQAVNRKSLEITKQQQESVWKSIKEKKGDISLGYCAVKIGVNLSGVVESKPFIPSYTNYQSRVDNKFSSNIRSKQNVLNFNQMDSQHRLSQIKQGHQDSALLSKKYEGLKSEHEALERQREKIFSIGKTGKSKSNPKVKFFIIFLLCFVLGNFFKSILEPKPQPVKVEKYWYSDLFG